MPRLTRDVFITNGEHLEFGFVARSSENNWNPKAFEEIIDGIERHVLAVPEHPINTQNRLRLSVIEPLLNFQYFCKDLHWNFWLERIDVREQTDRVGRLPVDVAIVLEKAKRP